MEHKLVTGGEQFLPFARSRIKALKAAGLAYASQQFEIDGCTVKVRIAPEHEYITLGGSMIYMESGVQDLLNVLPGFEATYRPAIVRFTPRVLALSGKPPNKLANAVGRPLTDGDQTWSSAGCKPDKLVKTVDTTIGIGTSLHFESPDPVYCPSPDLVLAAKRMRVLNPPSVFTGKLHLFVQALYGSSRTDYELGSDSNGGTINQIALDTGKTRVTADGSTRKIFTHLLHSLPTSGLMLTEDGKYLLLRVASDKIVYRQMKKRYVAARTGAAKANPAEAEAVVLAGLVPSAQEHTATGPDMAGVAGTVLAYGWHFNDAGDEASIVLQKGETISGVRQYDGSPSSIWGTRNTRHTLHFAYDTDTGELSYTATKHETGLHIPYLQTKVFVPNRAIGGMDLILPGDPTPWNCYAELGPTPLYCYYSGDGELIVVEVTNGGMTTLPAVAGVDASNSGAVFGIASVAGCLGVSREFKSYSEKHVFGACGVSASGLFSCVGATEINVGQEVTQEIFLDYGATDFYNYLDSGGLAQLASKSFVGLASSSYTQTTRSNVSKIYWPLLVIPHDDACAVLAGYQQFNTGFVNEVLEFSYGNNSVHACTEPGTGPFEWGGPEVGLMSWGPRTVPLTPEQLAARPPRAGLNTMTSALRLYSSAGDVELSTYGASSRLDGVLGFPDRPYSALYEAAAFVNPHYQYSMGVTTSRFGAAKHSYLYDEAAPVQVGYLGGWPLGGTTPTGWA